MKQKITIKGVSSQELTCVECSDEKIEHRKNQDLINHDGMSLMLDQKMFIDLDNP
ncbi:12552_t:CDS:2 [Gigaspora rosea]|nr:12552_t:CDS:2 [Gigaspora rosea]